jgi:hypothetical protein
MKTNPHVNDEVYRIVGEEVAGKEFCPGPMARTVAECNGNRDLIQGLYIQFRYEELLRQIENEKGTFDCPNCGFRGRLLRKARGNTALVVILLFIPFLLGPFVGPLFLLFFAPGVAYLVAYGGYKGVCAKRGRTLLNRVL